MIAENPFVETYAADASDRDLVGEALAGDADALESLILQHQAWVYNVAVRMIWDPIEAEDVVQEVMIKAVTKLSTFKGDSTFRTWLYRITTNHVLNMKRRASEPEALTFSEYGRSLDNAPNLDLPDTKLMPVDTGVLVEEAKLGCLAGMLLCLDRRQRLVYVLAELFGATTDIGAAITDLTPANFRKILSRARHDLYQFMNDKCGLVNPDNPCRCARKTQAFIAAGYVDPNGIRFAHAHSKSVGEMSPVALTALKSNTDAHELQLHRGAPFLTPPDVTKMLKNILSNPDVKTSLRLT